MFKSPRTGRMDTELNEGETCIYEEDGYHAQCEILEKSITENNTVLSFKLKVMKVISVGPFGSIPEGEIMDVWKRLDCDTPGFWIVKEYSQRNFSHIN